MSRSAAAGGLALLTGFCLLLLAVHSPAAEIAQRGTLRAAFEGRIAPKALPRQGAAPIAVAIGASISTTDGSQPPPLTGFKVELNHAGRLESKGLPGCSYSQLQPATTAVAMRNCRAALVGEGSFSAAVAVPEQSPFPATGRLLAFNGREHGRPVIFAHVYGTEPVPTSFTLPLRISSSKGTYGTVLNGRLPAVSSDIAFVTAISMKLSRRFSYRGASRSYVSAGCPAPSGFTAAPFPLARVTLAFGATSLASTLIRECRVAR